jgi:hypothetical protein
MVKQDRLQKLYSTILNCANVHQRVLRERKWVGEGETKESRDARHVREQNDSKQGPERTLIDLALEQPEASEVIPIFDAFNDYNGFRYYNDLVSASYSDDEMQTALERANMAYSELQDICVKHLAP